MVSVGYSNAKRSPLVRRLTGVPNGDRAAHTHTRTLKGQLPKKDRQSEVSVMKYIFNYACGENNDLFKWVGISIKKYVSLI